MNVNDLKELTAQQYDACKARAVERVQQRIGAKPTRKQYSREYAPLFGALDILAAVIFLAALAVSSLHILKYSGNQATTSYSATAAQKIVGITVDQHTYGVIHQIGFILLAEAAMLLFFVLFRTRQGFERWSSFVLALLAMIFVMVANLSSGLNPFLSILAPAFTIGIGFRLEHLTAESLRRNADVDKRYTEALTTYERAQDDITTHPEYRPLLVAEVWSKLVSLKANASFADAPAAFRHAAVRREMEREAWAYGMDTNITHYTQSLPPIPAGNNGVSHRDATQKEVAQAAPLSAGVHSNGNGATSANGHS